MLPLRVRLNGYMLDEEIIGARITISGMQFDVESLRPIDHGYSIILVPNVVDEEHHVQDQLLALT